MGHPGLLILGVASLFLAALDAYQFATGRRLLVRRRFWSDRQAGLWAVYFACAGVLSITLDLI